MRGNGVPRHLLQVELQAAAEHGDRDFLRIGGREDEFHVLGRLFQRFQHRVEGVPGELMHLVDHVDLEAPARRGVLRGVKQLAHLVDLGVRRRVDLEQIDEAPGVNLNARRAGVAGLRRDPGLAIQAFRQDARKRGLAHASRAGEEIGVVQPLMLERVPKCAHDMLLPHKAREIPRPPLAGKDLIAHRSNRIVRRARPPALAATGCGCFLPDLTRFTRLQCGEARRHQF